MAGRDGEEKLVVFAAVQGELQGIEVTIAELARDACWNDHAGDFVGVNFRADFACGAKSGQVGGEAVGKIHRGCGDALAGEPGAEFDANFGIEVRLDE